MEYKIFSFILIVVAAILGVRIMKRIEPDNKIYPIYVTFIVIVFSIVVFLCAD